MRTFRASAIAVEEMHDINAFVVVLAERQDGSGLRIELQRSLSFDEQDRVLGMNTYCITTETGASYYGGVTRSVLGEDFVELRLAAQASTALQIDDGIRVEVPRESVPTLRHGLQRILIE